MIFCWVWTCRSTSGLCVSDPGPPAGASLDLGELGLRGCDGGSDVSVLLSFWLRGSVFCFRWERMALSGSALRFPEPELPAADVLGSSPDGEEDMLANAA